MLKKIAYFLLCLSPLWTFAQRASQSGNSSIIVSENNKPGTTDWIIT